VKRGPKYRLPFKRRLEGKTDYRKRLRLLYSKKMRLVVRKSLKHIRAQIVEFDERGDKTIVSASSEELKKFGWNSSTDNMPAAYLVGILLGKRALKKNISSAILDIGLNRNVKGSRVYAVLKGVLDTGLSVPHSPDVLPSEERIKGKHILDFAKIVKGDEKLSERQFTSSHPENIVEMFEKTKSNILGDMSA
jgi:large subunit ribosomal protein L18